MSFYSVTLRGFRGLGKGIVLLKDLRVNLFCPLADSDQLRIFSYITV